MKALLVLFIVLLLAGYVATVVALGLLLSPLFFLLLLLLLVFLAIPFVESRLQMMSKQMLAPNIPSASPVPGWDCLYV